MQTRPEDKRKGARRWVIVLAAAVVAAVYIFHVGREMTDFGVCYQGGRRIVQGETLYREADGHLQYKYAPVSALFFAPLALLPYEAAQVIWYILEFIFLAGIFFFSCQVLPAAGKRAAMIVAWTLLIELKFLAREVELGQVNLFILFLLTLMLYLFLRKKESAAGLLWGSSLFFKPYALVFLPYFLIKGRFQTLIAGLAAVLLGLSVPAVIYGFHGYLAVLGEWSATLTKSTSGLLASFDNASLYGFLLKAFPSLSKQATAAILLLVFLLLALTVLWMIKKGQEPSAPHHPEILESAFLLILIPLFSPLGWNYNYLYSLLAVMIIVAAWQRFPFALRSVLAINFLIISTSIIELWGRGLFHFYTHHALVVFNFLIVLVSLFYLRAEMSA